jgi:hypothetical protein
MNSEYKKRVKHAIGCTKTTNTSICTYFDCIKTKTMVEHSRQCNQVECKEIEYCKSVKDLIENFVVNQSQSANNQLETVADDDISYSPLELSISTESSMPVIDSRVSSICKAKRRIDDTEAESCTLETVN